MESKVMKAIAELSKLGFKVSNDGKMVLEESGKKISIAFDESNKVSYKLTYKGSTALEDIVSVVSARSGAASAKARKFKDNKPVADIVFTPSESIEKKMGYHLNVVKPTPKQVDDRVKAYRANNPSGTKCQCVKETGLSYNAVVRHWNGYTAKFHYKADEVTK